MCVSAGGSRMLSALLATKATPRRIHIVPSVMMKGWTRRPTTMAPFKIVSETSLEPAARDSTDFLPVVAVPSFHKVAPCTLTPHAFSRSTPRSPVPWMRRLRSVDDCAAQVVGTVQPAPFCTAPRTSQVPEFGPSATPMPTPLRLATSTLSRCVLPRATRP